MATNSKSIRSRMANFFQSRGMNLENVKTAFLSIFLLILMIIPSAMIIERYYYVETQIKSTDNKNAFQNNEFMKDIYGANYFLYYKLYEKEHDKLVSPSTLFLRKDTIKFIKNNYDLDYYSGKLTDEYIINDFNEVFKNAGNLIVESNGNFKYLIINTKNHQSMGNLTESLTVLNKKSFAEMSPKEKNVLRKKVNENYSLFMVINFDENGEMDAKYAKGISKSFVDNAMSDLVTKEFTDSINDYDENGADLFFYKKEPIKNRTYIYAVPKNLKDTYYTQADSVSYYIKKPEISVYLDFGDYVMLLMGVFAAIILIIPNRWSKYIFTFKRIKGWKFEINLIWISALFLYLFEYIGYEIMVRYTISGKMLSILSIENISIDMAKYVSNAVNFIYWMLIFYTILIAITYLKHIFVYGPIRYIRKNSIIYSGFTRLFKMLRKHAYNVFNIDIIKAYNQWIIGSIIVNALILLSISAIIDVEFAKPFLIYLVIYSIVLLVFLRKKATSIENDYEKILEITDYVSKANFEKDIKGVDVGSFTTMKTALLNVQKEYKRSVEEEVKSSKLKSELISNISHDLKTPLTSIVTYIELLKDENLDEETRKKYINTIDRKANRLKLLIDDLFEMSKAISGSVVLDLQYIDLVELTKQSLGEMEDKIEASGLIVKSSFPDKPVMMNLDGMKMFRVFENLIGNMCKYAMPNTRVHINLTDSLEKVKVEFKNITNEEINVDPSELTSRFVRGDMARNSEGSGLGLAIAKSFVELQGGVMNLYLDADLFTVEIVFSKIHE